MRTRIFLAHPISLGDLRANIRQACDVAAELMRAGYSVFVPALSCHLDSHEPQILTGKLTVNEWYEISLAWLRVSHAVLRLPGDSIGADAEVAIAHHRAIPVFRDMSTLRQSIQPTYHHDDWDGKKFVIIS